MEVHHHTHHDHGKKTWKNYFWEFFMLFLAVFCGFLAELQLEHYIEHQREKKFINQLLLDLESDEKNLADFLASQQLRIENIDSLFSLMRNKKFDSKKCEISFLARKLSRYGNYVAADGTISQLKFGGNLRLIKRDKIVTALQDYDISTKVLTQFISTSFQDILNYRISAENLFEAEDFYDMIDSNNEIIKLNNCASLLDRSPSKINSFLMRLQYMKSANGRYISMTKRLLQKEKNLKDLVKQEYHIQ